MNYLEQLLGEWYEFRGYFVRRNVKVGPRAQGGYEGELDIVGFHPTKRHLVHVEASMDSDSWLEREKKFIRKFDSGKRYIHALFDGLDVPQEIEQIALLGYGARGARTGIGGGKLLFVPELLSEIITELRDLRIATSAIPEDKPILRTLQNVAEYRHPVWAALNGAVSPSA
jgi:hypothetical protein